MKTFRTIQLTHNTSAILLYGVDNKDMISRWLHLTPGANWRTPDLGAYRDWLIAMIGCPVTATHAR